MTDIPCEKIEGHSRVVFGLPVIDINKFRIEAFNEFVSVNINRENGKLVLRRLNVGLDFEFFCRKRKEIKTRF